MKRLRLVILLVTLSFRILWAEDQSFDNVYALNFYDGISYNSTIIPPATKNVYILADSMNVLVFRETSLYYWSLTSELKADWATRNQNIVGTLVIKSADNEIRKLQGQPYIIQYDMKDMANTINVFWGNEALIRYQQFQNLQYKYNEDVYAYNVALQDYNVRVDQLLQESLVGTVDEANFAILDQVPQPPENFSLVSTEINLGYPLHLEEGSYEIWFEDEDSQIISQSKKNLISYPMLTESSGFKVFEENRWTVPADLPDAHKTIFTSQSAVLYLQPYMYKKFEKYPYELMINPQQTVVNDGSTLWVPTTQSDTYSKLNINLEEFPVSGFKVIQTAGSKLGYHMEPLPESDPEITFTAIKLDLRSLDFGRHFNINSESFVAVLHEYNQSLAVIIVFLSFFPLTVYVLIRKRNKNLIARRKETL